MPWVSRPLLDVVQEREQVAQPVEALRQQWTAPADVFSILLLVGGDIVNKALAQLSGTCLTPVTFSFGWVSYAITTSLLACVGDTKLMPPATDGACLVITVKNGYTRNNVSWVIARILRDYEAWMHDSIKQRLNRMLNERQLYMQQRALPGATVPPPTQTGLCVGVYEPSITKTAGIPDHDWIYWSGLLVAVIQVSIATIPLVLQSDWPIILITVFGTLLALVTGSLPAWASEKWPCRRGSHNSYILTQGNGSQHAILILGNGKGLNLEDLAVGSQVQYKPYNTLTRVLLGLVTVLWIVLLICAAGMTNNTGYLLAIGGVGMLQNVVVVGWRRNPSALGVHLDFKEVVGEMTAMDALLSLETKYPAAGRSLLPIFFPGQLLPTEVEKWKELSTTSASPPGGTNTTSSTDLSANNLVPESWTAHVRALGTP